MSTSSDPFFTALLAPNANHLLTAKKTCMSNRHSCAAPDHCAEALTTAAGIASGHVAVAKLREILRERSDVLTRYHAATAGLITEDTHAVLGEVGVQRMRDRLAHVVRTSSELNAARGKYADAVERVLVWASQQGDAIQLRDGQIALATDQQVAELESLFARVSSATAAESRLVEQMAPLFEQSRASTPSSVTVR